MAVSHAYASDEFISEERLEFERASMKVHTNHPGRILHHDGRVEKIHTTSASLEET